MIQWLLYFALAFYCVDNYWKFSIGGSEEVTVMRNLIYFLLGLLLVWVLVI